MRLVDAEYALKLAEDPDYGFESWNGNLYDVKCLLSDCPTVEAKPVVHAHWKDCEDPRNAFCTHCGLVIEKQTAPVYRYCRACGAQMDEVASDTNVGRKESISQAHENDNRKAGG